MADLMTAPAARTLPHRLPDLVPSDRKVVLARLLAVEEAERRGIAPTRDEIMAMAHWWRREYGLYEPDAFDRWLRFAGMELSTFWRLMRDLMALLKVLRHHSDEVDERMKDHLALHTVRMFVEEGQP